jgi:hypothetical protein
MTETPDPLDPLNDPAIRQRIIRQRNLVLAAVLIGFVILFFAITMAKMKHV